MLRCVMMRSVLENITFKQVAVALVILTAAVFGPFIGNGFVALDDNYLIYQNSAVTHFSWAGLVHVFSSYDPQLYIPLTFVSYQLNALIFGINPTAFHAVNLLLHCANVVLVLFVLRRLTGSLFVSALACALFAIHPLQTEAVLWAASRKDLLSGFFFLVSTLFYLRYRERDWQPKWWIWSVVFFALALLAKVSVITLPVWLLLIDWVERRPWGRCVWREKIPYVGLAIVFGFIAIIGKAHVLQSSGTLLNMLLPAKSAVFYAQKIAWPSGLSVIYPYEPSGAPLVELGMFVGIVGMYGIALLFLILRGKHRLVAFAMFTYLLFLAPSFSTFWKNGFLYFASDRYAYLAVIGMFLLVALVAEKGRMVLLAKNRSDAPVLIIMTLIFCTLIPVTFVQSAVWKDTESLYRNVLRQYPDSVMAHTNLGLELQQKKNLVEARQHYERAIVLDPHSVHAYFNLSSLENEEGHPEAAKAITLKIVDAFGIDQVSSASDLRAFLWLQGKLMRLSEPGESLRLIQKLIVLRPDLPEPYHALGVFERERGNIDAALEAFRAAAARGSSDVETYRHLTELDPADAEARKKLQELLP